MPSEIIDGFLFTLGVAGAIAALVAVFAFGVLMLGIAAGK